MPRRTKISLIIIGILIVISIIGFTFAYVGRKPILGNEDNTIVLNTIDYGTITVSFEDGNNSIDASMVDLTVENAGIDNLYMIKFEIESTSNIDQDIQIRWKDLINDFCLYRDENYECTNDSSDTYVGDELTYALYSCTSSEYASVTTADDSDLSSCTKISATTDVAIPQTGSTDKLHVEDNITLDASSTTYYIVLVKLKNIDGNQNYNMGKSFGGSINVTYPVIPTLTDKILEVYTPVADNTSSTYVSSGSGIDFASKNSPTNGQGLYINNKNSGSGSIKYFRGGTYCWLSGAAITSSTTCTNAGGTWDSTTYHCSLSDSENACTTAGGTFYELNNNVMFAGFAWKIISINADGSIRMIYNGTSPASRGASTRINTSTYNPSTGDNAYVGYMYGTAASATYALTHTNTNTSIIKGIVDTWYQNNLTSYASQIADSGFCNDRSVNSGLGYGTDTTYYGSYNRLNTLKTPSFSCSQANDLFTLTTSSIGNKALTYPIGLITADEVVYAGGITNSSNYIYYLQSGIDYWTITPFMFYLSVFGARPWFIFLTGDIQANMGATNSSGVRPVINLKSTSTVSSGTGTLTDPWIITE